MVVLASVAIRSSIVASISVAIVSSVPVLAAWSLGGRSSSVTPSGIGRGRSSVATGRSAVGRIAERSIARSVSRRSASGRQQLRYLFVRSQTPTLELLTQIEVAEMHLALCAISAVRSSQ